MTLSCDGMGNINPLDAEPCGAFACVEDEGCATSCTAGGQCSASGWCDTSNHTCQPRREDGASCTMDDQCVADHCEESTCGPVPEPGGPCTSIQDCDSPLICDLGVCVAATAVDPGELSCGVSTPSPRGARWPLLALGLAALGFAAIRSATGVRRRR